DAKGNAVYQGFGDTVVKGVQQVTGSVLLYILGVDIDSTALIDVDAVIVAAKHADKIVIALGKKCYPGNVGNIDWLVLSWQQLNLVYTLVEAIGKPVVAVLVESRPRRPDRVPGVAFAIVNSYLPGDYGGLSISEILCGFVNSLEPKLDALAAINLDYSQVVLGSIDDQTKVYSCGLPDADLASFIFEHAEKHSAFGADPSLPALTDHAVTQSFNDVQRMASRFASGLINNLGLERGDMVAVLVPNSAYYPAIVLGVLMAGMVCATGNPASTVGEMRHLLSLCKANAVVATELNLSIVMAAMLESDIHIPRHCILTIGGRKNTVHECL
ncbi:hypothetical protein GGI21_003633, partial [Coemansia aciculifera]